MIIGFSLPIWQKKLLQNAFSYHFGITGIPRNSRIIRRRGPARIAKMRELRGTPNF